MPGTRPAERRRLMCVCVHALHNCGTSSKKAVTVWNDVPLNVMFCLTFALITFFVYLYAVNALFWYFSSCSRSGKWTFTRVSDYRYTLNVKFVLFYNNRNDWIRTKRLLLYAFVWLAHGVCRAWNLVIDFLPNFRQAGELKFCRHNYCCWQCAI